MSTVNSPLAQSSASLENDGERVKSDLSVEALAAYFHLPIAEASRRIGVCATVLKKMCRKLNIPRWPHRKIKSLEREVTRLQQTMGISVEQDQRNLTRINQIHERKEFLMSHPELNFPSSGSSAWESDVAPSTSRAKRRSPSSYGERPSKKQKVREDQSEEEEEEEEEEPWFVSHSDTESPISSASCASTASSPDSDFSLSPQDSYFSCSSTETSPRQYYDYGSSYLPSFVYSGVPHHSVMPSYFPALRSSSISLASTGPLLQENYDYFQAAPHLFTPPTLFSLTEEGTF